MNLKEKICIITGASSGIGQCISIRFAKKGAKVVIADIDNDGAKKTLSQISNSAIFIKTDVRKEQEIKNLVDETLAKFGKIDVVVNSVGIYSPLEANIVSLPIQNFSNIMKTNFTSIFLLTKFTIPHLLKTKGNIINIASSLGLVPEAESPIYCSSKAAIIMFTKTTALNYSKSGVRINCVCPGPINTPLLRKAFPDEKKLKEYLRRNPMGRAGTPDEVANLALFLASSESSYITGGIYTVDGGESLT